MGCERSSADAGRIRRASGAISRASSENRWPRPSGRCGSWRRPTIPIGWTWRPTACMNASALWSRKANVAGGPRACSISKRSSACAARDRELVPAGVSGALSQPALSEVEGSKRAFAEATNTGILRLRSGCPSSTHRLPKNRLEILLRRPARVAQVDLVMAAGRPIPVLPDELVQTLDRQALGRVWPHVQDLRAQAFLPGL